MNNTYTYVVKCENLAYSSVSNTSLIFTAESSVFFPVKIEIVPVKKTKKTKMLPVKEKNACEKV